MAITKKETLARGLQATYPQLSAAAEILNTASDGALQVHCGHRVCREDSLHGIGITSLVIVLRHGC